MIPASKRPVAIFLGVAATFGFLSLIPVLQIFYPSSLSSVSDPDVRSNRPLLSKLATRKQENITRHQKHLGLFKNQTDPKLLEKIRESWLEPPSFEFSGSFSGGWAVLDPFYEIIFAILESKSRLFFMKYGSSNDRNLLQLVTFYRWSGLFIEPNPILYQQLRAHILKPWTINACLTSYSATDGTQPLLNKLSRNEEQFARHLFPSRQNVDPVMDESKKVTQCFPLISILAALRRDDLVVDYVSLDIEGAALPALEAVPWDFIYFKVLALQSFPALIGIQRTLMEDNGFLFLGFVPANLSYHYIFIHRRYAEERNLKTTAQGLQIFWEDILKGLRLPRIRQKPEKQKMIQPRNFPLRFDSD